jgi:hypothetical protein
MFETVFRKIIRLITKPFLGVLKRFVALLLCNQDFRNSVYRYAFRQNSKGNMSFLRVDMECDLIAKCWDDFFEKQTSSSLSQ